MNNLEDTAAAENALTVKPANELAYTQQIEADIKMAQLMCKSKFMLPEHFHNKPAECLGLVRISRLWNMDPYMVGQKTSIIKGRLMYEGQLINAAINNSRAMADRLRFSFEGEGEGRTCTAKGRIQGEAEFREVKVGMPQKGQAKNSPLWSGSQEDKDQQLTYKAARVWARRHAPELTLGIYSPEDDWTDPEPEKMEKKEGNEKAVNNRMELLEGNKQDVIDVTAEDFFETKEKEVIEVQEEEPEQSESKELVDSVAEEIEAEQNPPKCETCGDRQILENTDGDKEPCPDCGVKKAKPGKAEEPEQEENFDPETGEIIEEEFNF